MSGMSSVILVFAAAALYWGSGMGINPAWSTWVDALVPARIRAPYFSRHTRVTQFATLTGFVVGGLSLQAGAWTDERLTAFGVIFLLAAVCRLASAACFASQSEALPASPGHGISMREFCGRVRDSANGRLLFYLLSG